MVRRKHKTTGARPLTVTLTRPQLILALVACDLTFQPAHLPHDPQRNLVWVGKCIHCRSALVVDPKRPAAGAATVEHIVPQSLAGQHRADNLALACARCNHQKGSRLDPLGLNHPRLAGLIALLQHERLRRLRDPPAELLLPDAAAQWLFETSGVPELAQQQPLPT